MQAEQEGVSSSVDVGAVVAYLKGNPDFFDKNSDILQNLRIPHETGGAVSLIEKQVSVFRHKCTALEDKLGELITVARENEQLHKRLHVLIQEVITAATLDDVVTLTRDTLIRNFRADEVKVFLIEDADGERHQLDPKRFLGCDDPALKHFRDNFRLRRTSCSVPTDGQREFLFKDSDQAGSIAVIPLQYKRDLGLVVLSSTDAGRFDSNKGVLFLNELGEVLSRRVAALL